MTRHDAEASIRSISRRCRGVLPVEARAKVNTFLGIGKHREAAAHDAASRIDCGADFNDLILSNPLDGQERAYRCPKCGVTGTYQSPLFIIDE